MVDSQTPADDRTDESADMVEESPGGAADLTGAAADATAEKMHGESDEIAEDAGLPGHGTNQTS
jgi:hypothetical protein